MCLLFSGNWCPAVKVASRQDVENGKLVRDRCGIGEEEEEEGGES